VSKGKPQKRGFRFGRVKVVALFCLLALMIYFLVIAILVRSTNLIVTAVIINLAYLYLIRLTIITGSLQKAWRR
jgi:hypothetical protein